MEECSLGIQTSQNPLAEIDNALAVAGTISISRI